jgi:hypothetical protein
MRLLGRLGRLRRASRTPRAWLPIGSITHSESIECKALNEKLTASVGHAKNYASNLAIGRTYATDGRTLGDDICEFPKISLH